MKKLLYIVALVAVALTLVSCGGGKVQTVTTWISGIDGHLHYFSPDLYEYEKACSFKNSRNQIVLSLRGADITDSTYIQNVGFKKADDYYFNCKVCVKYSMSTKAESSFLSQYERTPYAGKEEYVGKLEIRIIAQNDSVNIPEITMERGLFKGTIDPFLDEALLCLAKENGGQLDYGGFSISSRCLRNIRRMTFLF